MLNKLLWRCPVCKTNDAIVVRKRFLRPDRVSCSACSSAWDLLRVLGGTDYRLAAIAGPKAGTDRPLAEWYDMMREGFVLTPVAAPPLPLEPGEVLYLQGWSDAILVPPVDPRFQPAIAKALASGQQVLQARLDPSRSAPPGQTPPVGPGSGGPPGPTAGRGGGPSVAPLSLADLGPADLFLTDRRLILRLDGQLYDLPLATVRAVQVLIDRMLIIRHEKRLVEALSLIAESPLKWRAYLDLALRPIAETHGFQLHMAYD